MAENEEPKNIEKPERSSENESSGGASGSTPRSNAETSRERRSHSSDIEPYEETSYSKEQQSSGEQNSSSEMEPYSRDSEVEPYDRKQRHQNSSSNGGQEVERHDPDREANSSESGAHDGKSAKTEDGNKNQNKEQSTGSTNPKRKPFAAAGGKIAKTAGSGAALAGGAIAGAGMSGAGKALSSSMKSNPTEDSGDAPAQKQEGIGKKAVKKAGRAVAARAGDAMKALLFSPKGLIVLLILALIPIIIIAFIIVSTTTDRTISHTQKYGCVEDKFTLDFLEMLSPGNGQSIGDAIGGLFSDTEKTCKDGSGWTGEFYPPTIGNVTTEWYYDPPTNQMFHGATDIAAAEGSPIFAYAGGEVIKRVDGTENTAGWPNEGCNRDAWKPWSYTQSVQGDIVISHQPGILETRYAHMWKETMTARVGDIVSAGDQIAGQGNSGWSCGTHLHFEITESGVKVNPIDHMRERGIEFPYTLETLPEKPEGGTGENAHNVPPKLMQHAIEAFKSNGMPATSSEQTCLAKLWNRESNWRVDAINPQFSPSSPHTPEYQAYGIPQSGPGNKMASAGSDWKTNPQTQIKWGIGYIKGRYGTACEAWAHSEANNWY